MPNQTAWPEENGQRGSLAEKREQQGLRNSKKRKNIVKRNRFYRQDGENSNK
jgi:hypothetical protein